MDRLLYYNKIVQFLINSHLSIYIKRELPYHLFQYKNIDKNKVIYKLIRH